MLINRCPFASLLDLHSPALTRSDEDATKSALPKPITISIGRYGGQGVPEGDWQGVFIGGEKGVVRGHDGMMGSFIGV